MNSLTGVLRGTGMAFVKGLATHRFGHHVVLDAAVSRVKELVKRMVSRQEANNFPKVFLASLRFNRRVFSPSDFRVLLLVIKAYLAALESNLIIFSTLVPFNTRSVEDKGRRR